MATYLDTPAHPATVAYLANGNPLRQNLVSALASPSPYVPPRAPAPTQFHSSDFYHQALGDQGLTSFAHVPQSAAGAVAPSAPAPSAGAGGGLPNMGNLDYQADPILQKVIAAMNAALTTARGNALSQYKDLLLGFGSQELAKSTLGDLLKQPGYKDLAGAKKLGDYYKTISDNPDTSQSTMARLARAIREATTNTNNALSSSQGGNLFFSGARARQLRDLDYEHQGQVADATQALRQALFGVMQGETATEQSWQQQELAAEEAAYSRQLEFALQQAALAQAAASAGSYGGGGGAAPQVGGGTPYQQSAGPTPFGGAAPQPFVPWNVKTGLASLPITDYRVRRLA